MDNFPDVYTPPDTARYGEDPNNPTPKDIRPVFYSVTDSKLYAFQATDQPPASVTAEGSDMPVSFPFSLDDISTTALPNPAVDTYWLPISYMAIALATVHPIAPSELAGINDAQGKRRRIDGVPIEPGMRILVHTCTDSRYNGIFIVKTSGWVHVDETVNAIKPGLTCYVLDGIRYSKVLLVCTSVSPVPWRPGVSNLWSPVTSAGGTSIIFQGEPLPPRDNLVFQGDGVVAHSSYSDDNLSANYLTISGSNDAVVTVAVDRPVDFTAPLRTDDNGNIILDGHTLYPGDTVLLNGQNNPATNGVYRVIHPSSPEALKLMTTDSIWHINAAHTDGATSLLDLSSDNPTEQVNLPLGTGDTAPRLLPYAGLPYTWVPITAGNGIVYTSTDTSASEALTLTLHANALFPVSPDISYNLLQVGSFGINAADWNITRAADGKLHSVKRSANNADVYDTKELGVLNAANVFHRFVFASGVVTYSSSPDGAVFDTQATATHVGTEYRTVGNISPVRVATTTSTDATPTGVAIYSLASSSSAPLVPTALRAPAGYTTTHVRRPVVVFGGSQHMSVTDDRFASLSTKPFTVLALVNSYGKNTSPTDEHIVSTTTFSHRRVHDSLDYSAVVGNATLTAPTPAAPTDVAVHAYRFAPALRVSDEMPTTSEFRYDFDITHRSASIPISRPAASTTITVGAAPVTTTNPTPTKGFTGEFFAVIAWDRALSDVELSIALQGMQRSSILAPISTSNDDLSRVLVRAGTYANRLLFYHRPTLSYLVEPRQLVADTKPGTGVTGDLWFKPRIARGYPLNLSVTPHSSTSLLLDWRTNPGASSYQVWQDYVLVTSQSGSVDTQYVHENLQPGTRYCYTVVSLRYDGTVIEASQPTCAVTAAPLLLTANAVSPTQIDLAWQPNPVAYDFLLQTIDTATSTATDLAITTDTHYSHTPLTPATSHTYRLTSRKMDDTPIEVSPNVTAVTPAVEDTPVARIVSSYARLGKVRLTWAAPGEGTGTTGTFKSVSFVSRTDRMPTDPTDGIVTGPFTTASPRLIDLPGPVLTTGRPDTVVYVRAYSTNTADAVNIAQFSTTSVFFLQSPIVFYPHSRNAFGRVLGWENAGRVRGGNTSDNTYKGLWMYGTAIHDALAGRTVTSARITVARGDGGPAAPMALDLAGHRLASQTSGPPLMDRIGTLTPPVPRNTTTQLPVNTAYAQSLSEGTYLGFGVWYDSPDVYHTWFGQNAPDDGKLEIWHSDYA